jgi:hypothetical protein
LPFKKSCFQEGILFSFLFKIDPFQTDSWSM